MSARLQPRVLAVVLLLSAAVAAGNGALNPAGIGWVGSPALIPTPFGLVHEPHLSGALKGVRFALRELQHGAAPLIALALVLGLVALLWRRLGNVRLSHLLEAGFRLGMAAMLLAACWYKLRNPADFAEAVAQYRLLPAPLVNGFALLLPAAELVVAVGLLVTPYARELYLLLTWMLLLFIAALGQALARRLGITCGCFAIADIPGSVGETWFSLLRDVVLLVPAAWLSWRAENRFFWSTAAPR